MTILDTSVWVALLKEADTSHKKACEVVKAIHPEELEIYDYLYVETLTVLRNKVSNSDCYKFTNFLKELGKNIILSDVKVFELANGIFFQYTKLSFTDCLLMASAKLNNAQLVTLDNILQKAWNQVKK